MTRRLPLTTAVLDAAGIAVQAGCIALMVACGQVTEATLMVCVLIQSCTPGSEAPAEASLPSVLLCRMRRTPVSCRRLRGRRTSHRWSGTSPTCARIFFAKCNRCADKQDLRCGVASQMQYSTVQTISSCLALCSTESGSHLHTSQFEKPPDTQLLHCAGGARQAFRSGRQGGERPGGRRQWAAACQAGRHAPAGGRGSNRFAHA